MQGTRQLTLLLIGVVDERTKAARWRHGINAPSDPNVSKAKYTIWFVTLNARNKDLSDQNPKVEGSILSPATNKTRACRWRAFVGKLYLDCTARPRYFIEAVIGGESASLASNLNFATAQPA